VLTLVFVFLESYLILYPNVRTWPKIAPRFDAMGVGFGHIADSQSENLSVRYFRSFPLTSGLEVVPKPRHDGIVHPVMLYEFW
jgi:hypothetical protein